MDEKYDVIVFGGGIAGVSASLAAAEENVSVCLVEKLGWLGGMITGAYTIAGCGIWDGQKALHRTVAGNFNHIANEAIQDSAACWTQGNKHDKREKCQKRELSIDPEGFKYTLDRLVLEAGIKLKLHSDINDYWGKGEVYIDATGNGATALLTGASILPTVSPNDVVSMGVRLGGVDVEKIINKGSITLRNGRHHFLVQGWLSLPNEKSELFFDSMCMCDCCDDITKAETEGRRIIHEFVKELRKNHPGYENAYLISTGPTLGARKAKTVITQYYLSDEDKDKYFEDSIAVAGNVMAEIGYMEIPYRCMLPKTTEKLLYAGRTFTPQHADNIQENKNYIGYEIPRLVGPCCATGEAAGIAASMCIKEKIGFHRIDVKKLQNKLVKRGAIIHGVKKPLAFIE